MFSSLRSKILAGFFAIVLLNVAFALWTIYQFDDVGETTVDLVSATYELTATATRLVAIADRQLELLRLMRTQRDRQEAIARFERNTREFNTVVDVLASGRIARGRESIVHSLHASFVRFDRTARRYRLMLAGLIDGDARAQFADSVEPALLGLKQNCFDLIFKPPVELAEIRKDVDWNISRALLFVGIGTIAATLLGLVGGGYYSRWIVRPIGRLTTAARNVAGGRLDTKILIASNDELGDLSFEFNRMIERLRSYEEMNIEQLLLEKRKVETIVQSIATPIIVVDSTMVVLLMNPAAVDLLRLDPHGEYVGQQFGAIVGDPQLLPLVGNALAYDGRAGEMEPFVYARQVEGRERFYSVAVVPLATTSTVKGAVALFSDITHVKELDRLKSDFLAKVSHEFRTPLSSIIMGIDILREGILGEVNPSQLDLLDSSKEDCRRLSKLIGDILELSRVESRRVERVNVRLNLAAVVADTLKPHSLPAGNKGVQLDCQVADDLPEIWADPEELRWVINNLVSNAVRHTGQGGSVRVTANREADHLMIAVSDTGEGIPVAELARIFERFHQVGGEAVSTPGSVGLGLAIVKEVVESYGGRISVSSEPGRGSTFTVRIPFAALSARDRVGIENR